MTFRKRWVIGDIHGNYRGLKQCFERCGLDYEKDQVISLGDLADGYSELHLVMDELSQIHPDNLILIKGNHDEWFKEWLFSGIHPQRWAQGGTGSFKSYLKLIGKDDMWEEKISGAGWDRHRYYITALNPEDVPLGHQEMFRQQINYYIDDKNNLFIHGGFSRHEPLKGQPEHVYYWDRDLWLAALSFESMSRGKDGLHGKLVNKFKMKDEFNHIFIGHTSTQNWSYNEEKTEGGIIVKKGDPITTPMKAANIYNIDTGGGFDGKVTIMNIDNPDEYYQSDLSVELYPEDKGRR
jgi:serine/threonine protein phosphatase 1